MIICNPDLQLYNHKSGLVIYNFVVFVVDCHFGSCSLN